MTPPELASPTQVPTVLVIEDDGETQVFLHTLLTDGGYEVIIADSGEAGLASLEQAPVDLILLDLRLPDIDGLEVCQRIRESNAANPLILMLTADARRQGVVTGLELGADDYLLKPFAPDELLARIEALIRRAR